MVCYVVSLILTNIPVTLSATVNKFNATNNSNESEAISFD
jgi:hypothetical protein